MADAAVHSVARPSLAWESKPALRVFIVEIVAALLSVLAFRDGMSVGPTVLLESLSAPKRARKTT
jgi:hypothetical protein